MPTYGIAEFESAKLHRTSSWVNPVGGADERTISFEIFRHPSNEYRQQYRELDLVIDRGDHLVIGELKLTEFSNEDCITT